MKAIVDADACIACELCVNVCPEVFAVGPDGKAIAKVDPVPPEFEAGAQDAAAQCPVECIKIEK
jgi:ferredoxin